MVSNQQEELVTRTGASSGCFMRIFHAHWDCSYGVSGYSMFAACLDAAGREKAQRQLLQVERIIKNCLPEQVMKKFSLQMRRSAAARRVVVVHKRGLEGVASPSCTLENPNNHNNSSGGGVDRTAAATEATTKAKTAKVTMDAMDEMPQVNGLQIEKMLATADGNGSGSSSSSSSLPCWVREKSAEVFEEIGKAAANLCQTETTLDPVHIDYGLEMVIEVMGTLLSLHSLGVRTVSCSPIPLGSTAISGGQLAAMQQQQPAPLTVQLLIGLPTYSGPPATVLTGEFVTASGAALLRVLTGASRRFSSSPSSYKSSNTVNHRPHTMTLAAIGFGTSDTSQHVVRLSVGEVVGAGEGGGKGRLAQEQLIKFSNITPRMTTTPDTATIFNNNTNNNINNNNNTRNFESPSPNTRQKQDEQTSSSSSVLESPHWSVHNVVHIEANLDDVTSEHLTFALDVVLQNGAMDAWVTPIVTKNGRSAHTLHCLCPNNVRNDTTEYPNHPGAAIGTNASNNSADCIQKVLHAIFQQTSTLSIRIHQNTSQVALRCSTVKVQLQLDRMATSSPTTNSRTSNSIHHNNDNINNNNNNSSSNDNDNDNDNSGHRNRVCRDSVDVKVAYLSNTVVSVKPEFEHCKEIAISTGIPVQQVTQHATQAAREQLNRNHTNISNIR